MAVIRPLLIGFATTLKHIFKKPITVNYPDEKFPVFPKWRGVLMRDENGLESASCGLCSVACPADTIYRRRRTTARCRRSALPRSTRFTRRVFCGY
jgi:NADH-quinone oxidoreductase subunit I